MPDTKTICYYAQNAASLARRYESADIQTVQRRLAALFHPGSRVLELGCGSGRDAAFLLKRGIDVHAVDAVAAMLAAAVELHPELKGRLHCLALPDPLPFPDASFDGALALAMLMHLTEADLRATLRELHRVLAPGATLFASVPLKRGDLDATGRDHRGRQFTMMPRTAWETLLQAAGFTVEESCIDADGLNRSDIQWVSFTTRRNPSLKPQD